jgi:nicotinate-nucleotide adenylyltransferase
MKIGLFFGSFNPIHVGHLIIGSYFVEYSELQNVWYVISPQSPFKKRSNLLNEYDRFELVRLGVEDDDRLKPSDIEFNLMQPSYTIHTLLHLQEKYPNHEFVLLMGSDTVYTLPKWKNYEEILEAHEVYVYPRPNQPILQFKVHANVTYFDNAPLVEISSSFIRNSIKADKSVRYLVPQPALDAIDRWGFYK